MSPAVHAVFEAICAPFAIRGAVLEVGHSPGPASLLRLRGFRDASRRVGLNLEPLTPDPGCECVTGNANTMTRFADGAFACVVCNSTLEHDPFFWKTLAEIHRVTAPGGRIVIGVPGFAGMGPLAYAPRRSALGRVLRGLARLTGAAPLVAGTPTLGEHHFPGDHYRFSEQAVREVFLAGLRDVDVHRVLTPPRFIGQGRKT